MRWLGLLLTLVLLGVILRLTLAKDETPATARGPEPIGTTLGAPVPSDFATNAKSAADHTRAQTCLATCASDARTCTTIAADDDAIKACTEKHARCSEACAR